jgi:demethylmenaquinone methyltransferase/2-methoxy-6-polyprenyl-1,4-benzoquinol methylase
MRRLDPQKASGRHPDRVPLRRSVTAVFDLVAPRYDRFTRTFSFGMDAGWKRQLIDTVATRLPSRPIVLDLACGTGDVAFGLAARVSGASIVGVDPSPRMLAVTRERGRRSRAPVRFTQGDMMALPVPPASVDAVTVAYGLRNAPDHRDALREIARALRPGGVLASLDFYLPERRVWRRLFVTYLAASGSLYGWWWHREPAAYGYIARSLGRWVTARQMADTLVECGFRVDRVDVKLGGGIGMHFARRE